MEYKKIQAWSKRKMKEHKAGYPPKMDGMIAIFSDGTRYQTIGSWKRVRATDNS